MVAVRNAHGAVKVAETAFRAREAVVVAVWVVWVKLTCWVQVGYGHEALRVAEVAPAFGAEVKVSV